MNEENERVALWNRHTRQILLLSGAARETTYVPGIKAIWVSEVPYLPAIYLDLGTNLLYPLLFQLI